MVVQTMQMDLSQEVNIVGDGTGAKARVDVVGGTITNVTVSAGGKGYTYGIVDLAGLIQMFHQMEKQS